MNSMDSPAQVALVTGATSGFGREVARKLAAAGFSVLVHGRDADRGAAVVRVNTIAPGPAYTEGAAPERITALGNTTLLARAAEPDEIAEMIAFLASSKAAYITGAVIPVDGGRTAV